MSRHFMIHKAEFSLNFVKKLFKSKCYNFHSTFYLEIWIKSISFYSIGKFLFTNVTFDSVYEFQIIKGFWLFFIK